MAEIYLTTGQVASLMKMTDRAVRRKAASGGFPKQRTMKSKRGKETYLVALSSLPPDVQRKYNASKRSKAVSPKDLKNCTEKQREIAFERFEILQSWGKYAKEKGVGTSLCVDDYIRETLDGKVTRPTLYRWKKRLKDNGLGGLIPAWKNPRQPFQEDTISVEAKQWVQDFWLHHNLPSKKLAYNQLAKKAKKEGWTIPCYTTVKCLLNEIPEPVRILNREGKKAFDEKALPSILRDPSELEPMEVIECDHHQVDVATLMPNGQVIFPWLTLWMDVRTRKPLGWALVSRPNSDSINISLRETIIKYGIGTIAHLDNGKDMKAKIFTGAGRKGWIWGKRKIRVEADENAEGIYSELGMKVKWAIPYNAKSKQIERFFKTLRTEFSVFFRSYRGKDVKERPENLQMKIRNKNVVEFKELKKTLHQYLDIEYSHQRKHRGKGMENRTPNEVFYSLKKTKKTVREDELMLLCSLVPKNPTVQVQGIWLYDNWYYNENINFNYLGKKVSVRSIEGDISKIYVSDLTGKHLGIARLRHDAFWGEIESEEYRKRMRLKKHIKEATKEWEGNNIPVRMSDRERELLIIKESELDFTEPELESEYIPTKYADIIADEQLKEVKEKQRQKQINQTNQFFTSLDEGPTRGLLEKEVDNYILEFGKY